MLLNVTDCTTGRAWPSGSPEEGAAHAYVRPLSTRARARLVVGVFSRSHLPVVARWVRADVNDRRLAAGAHRRWGHAGRGRVGAHRSGAVAEQRTLPRLALGIPGHARPSSDRAARGARPRRADLPPVRPVPRRLRESAVRGRADVRLHHTARTRSLRLRPEVRAGLARERQAWAGRRHSRDAAHARPRREPADKPRHHRARPDAVRHRGQ